MLNQEIMIRKIWKIWKIPPTSLSRPKPTPADPAGMAENPQHEDYTWTSRDIQRGGKLWVGPEAEPLIFK